MPASVEILIVETWQVSGIMAFIYLVHSPFLKGDLEYSFEKQKSYRTLVALFFFSLEQAYLYLVQQEVSPSTHFLS